MNTYIKSSHCAPWIYSIFTCQLYINRAEKNKLFMRLLHHLSDSSHHSEGWVGTVPFSFKHNKRQISSRSSQKN